ncbi:MAG: multiheme c-type cytochrome [Ferruginibacter sp.]
MRANSKYRNTAVVISVFVVMVFVFARCMSGGEKKEANGTVDFENYAGSEKCASCHSDIYKKHLHTAHYLTSQPADSNFIKGSFEKGNNVYSYSPVLNVAMEKRDSGFYQVVYYKNEEKMAMRFDIVIGSGVMGQSFITKRNNRFYQMPVTYFTAAEKWSSSPGFPENKVMVDRPVTARCMECHATFAKGTGGTAMEPSSFEEDKMILGIGCERCHGPAAKHVEYQQKNPQEKKGMYVVNPAGLSRQQQLDICAFCHGGKIEKTKPSFSFMPGQRLEDYFAPNSLNQVAVSQEAEVHGNQYGLLRASKCFIKTNTLTCNTCHNSHQQERGDLQLYSSRCITCHDTKAGNFKTATHSVVKTPEQNCISCHMPQQPSKAIAVFLEGGEDPVASMIRSHFIGIYPETVKKMLSKDSTLFKTQKANYN